MKHCARFFWGLAMARQRQENCAQCIYAFKNLWAFELSSLARSATSKWNDSRREKHKFTIRPRGWLLCLYVYRYPEQLALRSSLLLLFIYSYALCNLREHVSVISFYGSLLVAMNSIEKCLWFTWSAILQCFSLPLKLLIFSWTGFLCSIIFQGV